MNNTYQDTAARPRIQQEYGAEMVNDVGEVLISAAAIQRRNEELAREILPSFHAKAMSVIIISNGALFFGADLVRCFSIPLELDTISASSYTGTTSRQQVDIHGRLRLDIRDRHVLLVDDIFDSGLTLRTVSAALWGSSPASLHTCVLLRKQRARELEGEPDFVGFEVADRFVVGYGLDFNEQYRNLPYIAVLDPQAAREQEAAT